MYEYNGVVRKVYDGDTIRADIDLGFDIWVKNKSLRLLDIDTPEIRGNSKAEGIKSKNALLTLIKPGDDIIINTHTCDKYGRWLAYLYIYQDEFLLNINQWLLSNNYAIKY